MRSKSLEEMKELAKRGLKSADPAVRAQAEKLMELVNRLEDATDGLNDGVNDED